jgi:hypothetical protein
MRFETEDVTPWQDAQQTPSWPSVPTAVARKTYIYGQLQGKHQGWLFLRNCRYRPKNIAQGDGSYAAWLSMPTERNRRRGKLSDVTLLTGCWCLPIETLGH